MRDFLSNKWATNELIIYCWYWSSEGSFPFSKKQKSEGSFRQPKLTPK